MAFQQAATRKGSAFLLDLSEGALGANSTGNGNGGPAESSSVMLIGTTQQPVFSLMPGDGSLVDVHATQEQTLSQMNLNPAMVSLIRYGVGPRQSACANRGDQPVGRNLAKEEEMKQKNAMRSERDIEGSSYGDGQRNALCPHYRYQYTPDGSSLFLQLLAPPKPVSIATQQQSPSAPSSLLGTTTHQEQPPQMQQQVPMVSLPLVSFPTLPYYGLLKNVIIELDSAEISAVELDKAEKLLSGRHSQVSRLIHSLAAYHTFGPHPSSSSSSKANPTSSSSTHRGVTRGTTATATGSTTATGSLFSKAQYVQYLEALCDAYQRLFNYWRLTFRRRRKTTGGVGPGDTLGQKRSRGQAETSGGGGTAGAVAMAITGINATESSDDVPPGSNHYVGFYLICTAHPLWRSFTAMFFIEEQKLCVLLISESSSLRQLVTKSLLEVGVMEEDVLWISGALLLEYHPDDVESKTVAAATAAKQKVGAAKQQEGDVDNNDGSKNGCGPKTPPPNLVFVLFDILVNLRMNTATSTGTGSSSSDSGSGSVGDAPSNRGTTSTTTAGTTGTSSSTTTAGTTGTAMGGGVVRPHVLHAMGCGEPQYHPATIIANFGFNGGTQHFPRLQRHDPHSISSSGDGMAAAGRPVGEGEGEEEEGEEQYGAPPSSKKRRQWRRRRYSWSFTGGGFGNSTYLLPQVLPGLVHILESRLGLTHFTLLPVCASTTTQFANTAEALAAASSSTLNKAKKLEENQRTALLPTAMKKSLANSLLLQHNTQGLNIVLASTASALAVAQSAEGLNTTLCCSRLSCGPWEVFPNTALQTETLQGVSGVRSTDDPELQQQEDAEGEDVGVFNKGDEDNDADLDENDEPPMEVSEECEFYPTMIRRFDPPPFLEDDDEGVPPGDGGNDVNSGGKCGANGSSSGGGARFVVAYAVSRILMQEAAE